ncbi:hypothetical protein [Siphonobacter sp. BAB-5405]|uniref:hypothetical protein n=1 Tax=Siphonobacter sp. BAB-5405 TaxID=1864825 RepID=UPI0011AED0FB|nr:hypothetical protein [Siphonobacter sp. BAB-5405]
MSQQSIQVGKQGGMANKYKVLIGYLLEGHQNSRIIGQTGDSLTVGCASTGGQTIFNLVQTFGSLTVEWKMESPLFGKHRLEWQFPEYEDQEKMMRKLTNDLEKYQQNVISASPFRDSFLN